VPHDFDLCPLHRPDPSSQHQWWHLLIFRFLAALGIGGEWAVGASLLAETWPSRWRPWLAAILQSAVNCGVAAGLSFRMADRPTFTTVSEKPGLERLIARSFSSDSFPRSSFFGSGARCRSPRFGRMRHDHAAGHETGIAALFRPALRRTTLIVIAICSLGLTAHWALMFWHSAHLRALARDAGWSQERVDVLANHALYLLTIGAIVGISSPDGWRVTSAIGGRSRRASRFYFILMMVAYGVPRKRRVQRPFLAAVLGASQGAFALFTMSLPPLFPTLVRNYGRRLLLQRGPGFAATGTVVFGLFAKVGSGADAICDHRLALWYAGFLFSSGGASSRGGICRKAATPRNRRSRWLRPCAVPSVELS